MQVVFKVSLQNKYIKDENHDGMPVASTFPGMWRPQDFARTQTPDS